MHKDDVDCRGTDSPTYLLRSRSFRCYRSCGLSYVGGGVGAVGDESRSSPAHAVQDAGAAGQPHLSLLSV